MTNPNQPSHPDALQGAAGDAWLALTALQRSDLAAYIAAKHPGDTAGELAELHGVLEAADQARQHQL